MNSLEIKSLSQEMEDKIILSATRLFVLKGKAGTSMQDIAEEAGINRTLLNYYFRSKDNLFEQVFSNVFNRFLPVIVTTLNADIPVNKKLENFIDHYYTVLIENPVIPLFILQELTSNPQRLIQSLKTGGVNINLVLKSLEDAMEKGFIRQMNPKEIMVNLMSLIIFPFAARKIIEEMIFSADKESYTAFLLQRKESLKSSFIQSLKP
jgi:TetR/AcrR family transcriptional regulator